MLRWTRDIGVGATTPLCEGRVNALGLPCRRTLRAGGTTRPDPRINFGQLTLPEATDLVGRQALALDPSVDRLFGDPEVCSHLVD